jgi:hypothetical protein
VEGWKGSRSVALGTGEARKVVAAGAAPGSRACSTRVAKAFATALSHHFFHR